jgi:hypothetical protein
MVRLNDGLMILYNLILFHCASVLLKAAFYTHRVGKWLYSNLHVTACHSTDKFIF